MLNDQTQLKVAFYIRVSTEEQVEKFGIPLQRNSLKSYISSKVKLNDGRDKMVLAGKKYIYIDRGISGTTGLEERPEFSRLQSDILNAPEGNRPFDVVAVYKIDRFARKLKVLLDVIDFFDEKDIQFISVNESIDTSTPFGRAMLGIIGVIAELEIETFKERSRGGREAANKIGVVMGATPKFGYIKDIDKKLVVLEEEAKVVRMIFDKYVSEQLSPQAIADYLVQGKYLSPDASAVKNKKRKGSVKKKNDPWFWRSEKVRAILSDEAYLGKYYYDKIKNNRVIPKSEWKLSPHRHQSIVDTFTFNKAQLILSKAKSFSNSKNKTKDSHLYLLSGLLKCDCCRDDVGNENLMTWTGDRKKIKKGKKTSISYSYKCGRRKKTKHSQTCGTVPIPAQQLEEYVVEIVKGLINNPDAVYEYYQQLKSTKLMIKKLVTERKRWIKLIENIPGVKKRYKEQHTAGIIDLSSLKKSIKRCDQDKKIYQKKIDDLDHQISQKSVSKSYLATLKLFKPQYVKSLEKMYKNQQEVFDIIHMLIDKIIVYSRPVRKTDKIAGRKTDRKRFIPNKIEIELKLPQEILNNLATGFGVKIDNL